MRTLDKLRRRTLLAAAAAAVGHILLETDYCSLPAAGRIRLLAVDHIRFVAARSHHLVADHSRFVVDHSRFVADRSHHLVVALGLLAAGHNYFVADHSCLVVARSHFVGNSRSDFHQTFGKRALAQLDNILAFCKTDK